MELDFSLLSHLELTTATSAVGKDVKKPNDKAFIIHTLSHFSTHLL